MQTNLVVESAKRPLTVTPFPLEIVIAEDGVVPVTLVLPPLEDILEMQALKNTQFSLKELATQNWHELEDVFIHGLNFLETKKQRFGNSPIYLNRLANFAEMAGKRDKEIQYLKEAKGRSDNSFFDHRIGDNLLATNNAIEAERIFSALDLKSDSYANLRMAYFNIQRRQFDVANNFVAQALKIDPLNFGAHLLEGALGIVQGNYEQAIRSFRIAEEERPGSSSIHMNMAVAYVCLHRPLKALVELRKAVALEPLNQSAVMLLADLSFSQKCDEDAVPSMRFFLEFEQKNPEIWARLARAMLRLGNTYEAIAALKRQGSIKDTSEVWNNLGVAYTLQHNHKKAYEALTHALKKDSEDNKVYFIASLNIGFLLFEQKRFAELAKFTSAVLSEDIDELAIKDPVLSDIWTLHLHSLWAQKLMQQSVSISESLISRPEITPRLAVWVISWLIAHLALTADGGTRAIAIIEEFKNLLGRLSPGDSSRKEMLLNNIAFVYAEHGLCNKAEEILQNLSGKIHKDPYPTATLGLVNIRKGHFERGEHLYEEAIHLAHIKSDKIRIRQKLNFELAKLHLADDVSKSYRYLQKVIDQTEGAPELVTQAKQLQKGLPKNF